MGYAVWADIDLDAEEYDAGRYISSRTGNSGICFWAWIYRGLVKSPRIYMRDSGLTHALLGLADANQLSGHPVYGSSWEGFVIENLLACAPERTAASYYRTAAGAEIDLVLDLPGSKRWTVEIKSGLTPGLEKGFYNALEDIKSDQSFVITAGDERYPITPDTDAISLPELAQELRHTAQ